MRHTAAWSFACSNGAGLKSKHHPSDALGTKPYDCRHNVPTREVTRRTCLLLQLAHSSLSCALALIDQPGRQLRTGGRRAR